MTKERKSDSLLKEAKSNLAYLAKDDEELSVSKKIVCSFYKNGSYPKCSGCSQEDETVEECKSSYMGTILNRPMESWSKEFDAYEVREKTSIAELPELGLNCDNCYIAKHCPLHKVKSMCAVNWEVSKEATPKEAYSKLIEMQRARIMRATKYEEIDGGIPDQNLSVEMDRLAELIKAKSDLDVNKFSMKIESRGNNSGILKDLFGPDLGIEGKKEEKPETIDIDAEIIEPEKPAGDEREDSDKD